MVFREGVSAEDNGKSPECLLQDRWCSKRFTGSNSPHPPTPWGRDCCYPPFTVRQDNWDREKTGGYPNWPPRRRRRQDWNPAVRFQRLKHKEVAWDAFPWEGGSSGGVVPLKEAPLTSTSTLRWLCISLSYLCVEGELFFTLFCFVFFSFFSFKNFFCFPPPAFFMGARVCMYMRLAWIICWTIFLKDDLPYFLDHKMHPGFRGEK